MNILKVKSVHVITVVQRYCWKNAGLQLKKMKELQKFFVKNVIKDIINYIIYSQKQCGRWLTFET